MVAPLAQFVARQSWLGAALAATVGVALCWLTWRVVSSQPQLPRWIWMVEWCFLTVLLPDLLRQTGLCWPDANRVPTIPLILLLLAVLSAEQGAIRAARASATVFWFIGLLMAGILGAGVKELHGAWMLPTTEFPAFIAFWVFLLPALLVLLPRDRAPGGGWLLGVGCLGVVIAAWTGGVISPGLAAEEEGAFYLYSKSLTVLGTAKRMEALASAVLTMSWFCTLSWLLTASGHAAEKVRQGWGRAGVWLAALLAGIAFFVNLTVPVSVTLAGSIVLWILLPMVFGKKKKKI